MGWQLPEAPHALTHGDLARSLQVDPVRGLEVEEAARRLGHFGPNALAAAKPVSPLAILLRQFQDLMVLILVAAAAVAVLAWYLEGARGLPADSIVIAAIVVLNAALGFVQEFRAEKTVEELRRMASTRARVVRGGQAVSVPREDLVPGDLVVVEEGDRVPADLVLLGAQRLRTDESLLTGESVPVGKRLGEVPAEAPLEARTGSLFAGTTVTAGVGHGLVVATGAATELGALADSLAATEAAPTPLELRLGHLGRQIGLGVLLLSLLIALTLLLVEWELTAGVLLRVLMFAVALAVAAVPEGLPAVLTISLSVGARRLARRNAVVRRLAAVETLGSVTTIVTDKTGTLTHNQMTVRRAWHGGREFRVSGRGYGSDGEIVDGPPLAGGWERMLAAGSLASTADLQDRPGRPRRALGDPTEAALLVLAEKAGLDWRGLRACSRELSSAPFSSERARMSSLREQDGEVHLFVKGSPEVVLARCVRLWKEGGEFPLGGAEREALAALEAAYGDQGLRTLALACRTLEPERLEGRTAEDLEEGLTFLGMVGLQDPPREAVPEAMRRCRGAGIRVLMLTGDHPRTALSVARAIELSDGPEAGGPSPVMTGTEVSRLGDAELDRALGACRVFARVSPQAKLRIVERLLAAGEVVAMTGDGVNDAPALKKVHVGVAMGSGTAVAVEASELVLLDDDFATLVTAVEGGRGVFLNVQRFIAFLFSGNLGVVLAMFAGTILAGVYNLEVGGEILLPLTAAQILWMNLVTDGAPAVAFSLGSTRQGVLDEPPRVPGAPLVTWALWRFVGVTGAWVALLLLAVLDAGYAGGLFTLSAARPDPAWARTAAFYTVVTTRLWNALNFQALPGTFFCRESWRDLFVPGACLVSWLLTLSLLELPALRELFHLVELGVPELAVLTALAPSVLLVGEAWKRLVGVRVDPCRRIGETGGTSSDSNRGEPARP